jgi:hypothetical protein
MDPYTTRGRARIQQHDIDALLRTHGFLTGAALGELERQRQRQVDVEWDSLLKQHGFTTGAATSLVAQLRQTIGAVLIRAGERLASTPPRVVSPETAPTAGTLGPVG